MVWLSDSAADRGMRRAAGSVLTWGWRVQAPLPLGGIVLRIVP